MMRSPIGRVAVMRNSRLHVYRIHVNGRHTPAAESRAQNRRTTLTKTMAAQALLSSLRSSPHNTYAYGHSRDHRTVVTLGVAHTRSKTCALATRVDLKGLNVQSFAACSPGIYGAERKPGPTGVVLRNVHTIRGRAAHCRCRSGIDRSRLHPL